MSASLHRRSTTTLLLLSVCAVCVCAMTLQEQREVLEYHNTKVIAKLRAEEEELRAEEEQLRAKEKERAEGKLREEEMVLNSTSRVEQGTVHHSGTSSQSPTTVRQVCTFAKTFLNVPAVQVYFSAIDAPSMEITAHVTVVSTKSFTLEVRTASQQSAVYNYKFAWLAVDPTYNSSTVFYTLAVEGSTHNVEQRLPYGPGAFPTTYAVGMSGVHFVAGYDRRHNCSIRLDEEASQYRVTAGDWDNTGARKYQEISLFGTAHPNFESGNNVVCKTKMCEEVIHFKSKCDGRRTVTAFLSQTHQGANPRFRQMADATLITQDSFTLVQACGWLQWWDSECYLMGASWIAHCEKNY